MAQELTPGGKDKTLVKGAKGAWYIIDKKGTVTLLNAAECAQVDAWIEKAEGELSGLGLPPLVGGGVNLCLPEVFPD
jgi:hypothetical protein